MPMTPVPATLPAVPNAPGVPPMGPTQKVISTAALVLADVAFLTRLFLGPQWGIFDSTGQPVLQADSVRGLDFRREWAVSDFQIEQGQFGSINKVQIPADVRITFQVTGAGGILDKLIPGTAFASLITGGSLNISRREQVLQILDVLGDSFDLYTVATPEFVYENMTIVHIGGRREAEAGGASNIPIEVYLREIREIAPASKTDTAAPSGQDAQSQGAVETTATTPAQNTAANGLLAGPV